MSNSKLNKNANSKSESTTVIIHCLNNLYQETITKYLASGEKHLVYTTQDQLDKLFTVFSNSEKEK
jgi:bisphosphoglycerate-dependent phosphoglycerate mutase